MAQEKDDRRACCGDGAVGPADQVKAAVRQHYGARARGTGASCCCGDAAERPCCGGDAAAGAGYLASLGYRADEIKGVPAGAASCSAGCGNPFEGAELKPGETVLDIGSGGGLDAIIAARRVGPAGRVIGLDFTPEMLDLARRNAAEAGLGNAEFRMGDAEAMPVDDASVDVIVSNCVINLAPDKRAVFREAHRVLRPGGRLVISDIVTSGLPAGCFASLEEWVECVGGALPEQDYLDAIRAAGFAQVEVWKRVDETPLARRLLYEAARAGGRLGEMAERATEHLADGGQLLSVGVRAIKAGPR